MVLTTLWPSAGSSYSLENGNCSTILRFQHQTDNQKILYKLIHGMQEIKLTQFEQHKRNRWDEIPLKLLQIKPTCPSAGSMIDRGLQLH
ncbi:MAG: hypothetical protein ABI045_01230 [Flavobacteriales bacterium]